MKAVTSTNAALIFNCGRQLTALVEVVVPAPEEPVIAIIGCLADIARTLK